MERVIVREGHLRVQLANRLALKYGVELVRQILANKDGPLHGPAGMTTEELYRFTLQQTPSSEYYNPHVRANKPYPPIPTPRTKGKQRVQPPAPPHPEHPIRSKVFLKKSILQYLVGTQELAKARVERVLDVPTTPIKSNKKGKKELVSGNEEGKFKHIAWVWKAADPAIIKPSQPQKSSPYTDAVRTDEISERDVGVGDDFSHLSRRRQKARREDIRRDTRKLKEAMRQEKVAMRQQKVAMRQQKVVMRQQKEEPAADALYKRLQAARTAKKSPQEQDWEDRRSAVRKPLTRNRK